MLWLLCVAIILVFFLYYNFNDVLGHNDQPVSVPMAKTIISPDDMNSLTINDQWEEAIKISFPGANLQGKNVSLYLKYELKNKTLDGLFKIPDDTPHSPGALDVFILYFDVGHNASQEFESDDHKMMLYRDNAINYLQGKGLDKSESGKLALNHPFSQIIYNAISNTKGWQGYFKIYFEDSPLDYGFSVEQINGRINLPDLNSTIYPRPFTTQSEWQESQPSTWGDIVFNLSIPIIEIKEAKVNGLELMLNGVVKSQSGGNITNIEVNWGDGNVDNLEGNALPITHLYSQPGSYDVLMVVYDSYDLSSNASTHIKIENPKIIDDNSTLINPITEIQINEDNNPINSINNPIVIAAIIGLIGTIIGAWLNRTKSISKKRRSKRKEN